MQKAVCNVSVLPLRNDKAETSEMVSQMLYGEICEVLETENRYSRICMQDGTEGWVNTLCIAKTSSDTEKTVVPESFGVFDLAEGRMLLSAGSEIEADFRFEDNQGAVRERIGNTALLFVNVPFLFGGRSFFGIDAAALVQLVYKMHGIRLPRFAAQQATQGRLLDFIEESECGDIAFFDDEGGNINHAGIMLSNYEILHCYGKVRIDSIDSSGIFNSEQNRHTHRLRFVKSFLS